MRMRHAFCGGGGGAEMPAIRRQRERADARGSRRVPAAAKLTGYFFDGQGAPHGAQAPAKSCGETARPIDGDVT